MLHNNNYLSSGVPVQISEMTEWDAENRITKRSILLNIKELSAERGAELLKELRERVMGANAELTTEKPETPKNVLMCSCGGQLILRKGSRGFFFGCAKYPLCRQTISANDRMQPKSNVEEVPVIEY